VDNILPALADSVLPLYAQISFTGTYATYINGNLIYMPINSIAFLLFSPDFNYQQKIMAKLPGLDIIAEKQCWLPNLCKGLAKNLPAKMLYPVWGAFTTMYWGAGLWGPTVPAA
jgi:hypothetical protein